MLVLSRKSNERLIIDHNIEVAILEIRGGSVRIGIKAPRQVSIVRTELCPVHSAGESTMAPVDQVEVAPQRSSKAVLDSLIDVPSNQILHSLCERRRTGRLPVSPTAASEPQTEYPGAIWHE